MAHVVGDIVEVNWVQALFGQRMLNRQHYRVTSSTSSSSDVADNASFANHLAALTGAGQLITVWNSGTVGDRVLQRVRAQKIYTVRSQFADAVIGMSGVHAGECDSANIAGVVTKRGTSGTRRSIGGLHFGGLPRDFYSAGDMQAGFHTWWSNMEPLWSATQNVASSGVSYQPVLYNPGSTPNYQTISDWLSQTTLRVMRRRTVGLGE